MQKFKSINYLFLFFLFAFPLHIWSDTLADQEDCQCEILINLNLGPFDNWYLDPLVWRRLPIIKYSKQLTRFNGPTVYEPCNAAALIEVNNNVTVVSGMDNHPLPLPQDFDKGIPIIGKDPINSQDTILAYILTSEKHHMVVVSLIGTRSLTQSFNNFDFFQVSPTKLHHYQKGMLVERGFYRLFEAIYQEIRDQVATLMDDDAQLVITGFSLGGGIATLVAFDLAAYKPIVYTFASPRVGNPFFAQSYNQIPALSHTWRIYNTEDSVPTMLPSIISMTIPESVYEHVGNPIPFTKNLGDQEKNHTIAYHDVIVKQTPPTNPNGMCPKRYDCSRIFCPKPE